MNILTTKRQGIEISKDEWRLQWRSWGTWLVGLFFLAVVISEHPFLGNYTDLSIIQTASLWADRVSIVGSLVAILTVPFAMDRVQRARAVPIEFTKPFKKSTYVLGKFSGATLPLASIAIISMVIHLVITLLTQEAALNTAVTIYLTQAIQTTFIPLLYISSLMYCLGIFTRRPIVIVPAGIFYLILTTATQSVADAKFSWLSPIVRPEYFGGVIPESWMPTVLAHHAIYLALSLLLLVLSVLGFNRERVVDNKPFATQQRQFQIPAFSFISVKLRMFWGGHVVAALLAALVAVANTMSNPNPFLRVEYAFFGLEFYLPLAGLLLLAGVVTKDKTSGSLDLVLTKPVQRLEFLIERLIPALVIYTVLCIISVVILNAFYETLPIAKSLMIASSTGLYLGLFGMTIANITKNSMAGLGAGALYWITEAAFNGRFTAPFYLLIVSHQVPVTAGDVWMDPAIWLPVKIGSLILAALLFLANGWLLDEGPVRRRTLIALSVGYPLAFALGWWLVPLFV